MKDQKMESWASGDLYHQYMGRWSEMVAHEFLSWLYPLKDTNWLDVGCGTGALVSTILKHTPVKSVIGIDPSQDFLDQARRNISSLQVQFQIGNGTSLQFVDDAFNYVVSALALNFMPDPQQAIMEMARVVKPDGWVAIYVWDYAGKMEWLNYFWLVAVLLDEAANQYDEGQRFPMCHPAKLQTLFENASLNAIEVRAIDVPAHFNNFEQYWALFNIGSFPAPAYLKALTQDQQDAFKDKLRAIIPIQSDGSIELITRAWAVRGIKS